MNTLTAEQYRKLIEQLFDKQYNELSDEELADAGLLPEKSYAKEQIKSPENNAVLDLTNTKRDDIIAQLQQKHNIRVGSFLIRTGSYRTEPENIAVAYSVSIYEELKGFGNKKIVKVRPYKDNRFAGRSWTSNFDDRDNGDGKNIPMIDLVKWLQAISKMSAFL